MTAPRMIDDRYRPGVCNIGPREIARRRRTGYLGLLLAGALALALVVSGAAAETRLLVAAPLFVGLLGLAQARARFCVAFAALGVHDLPSAARPTREGATARIARIADLRRAASLLIAPGAISLVLVAILYLAPL